MMTLLVAHAADDDECLTVLDWGSSSGETAEAPSHAAHSEREQRLLWQQQQTQESGRPPGQEQRGSPPGLVFPFWITDKLPFKVASQVPTEEVGPDHPWHSTTETASWWSGKTWGSRRTAKKLQEDLFKQNKRLNGIEDKDGDLPTPHQVQLQIPLPCPLTTTRYSECQSRWRILAGRLTCAHCTANNILGDSFLALFKPTGTGILHIHTHAHTYIQTYAHTETHTHIHPNKHKHTHTRPLEQPPAASASLYLQGREQGGGGPCTSCRTTCESASGAAVVGGGGAEADGAPYTTSCARVAGGANASGGPISRENSEDPCRRFQHQARSTRSKLQARGTVTRPTRCPGPNIKKSTDWQLEGTHRRHGPPASGPRSAVRILTTM